MILAKRCPHALIRISSMTDIHHQHKATIKTLSSALYDFDEMSIRKLLDRLISDTAICRFFHPVGDMLPGQLYDRVFAPLVNAMPEVERRDIICIAGEDQQAGTGSDVQGIILAGLSRRLWTYRQLAILPISDIMNFSVSVMAPSLKSRCYGTCQI